MSRTDAHRPHRVHLVESGAAQEWHDHTNGPCDLPDIEDVVAGRVSQGWRAGRRCGWWLTSSYQHDHSPFSKYSYIIPAKDTHRIRRAKRQEIAAQLVDADLDLLDLDD